LKGTVEHDGAWTEEYEEEHSETYTDSEGHSHTRTWTTTEHEHHSENWSALLNYGSISEERDISAQLFNEIVKNFGGVIEDGGTQSCSHFGGHYDGGDNNIYIGNNKTGYIYPTTTTKRFENRVKAAPTVFSFVKVPTNVPVYLWPENPDWMHSDRLLGASKINPREWDLMNTRLGAKKKVNVILVGFNSADPMLGKWQQAKWIGGRKNDLVLCYGMSGTNVAWTYSFGWTEKELCKRNLETILLTNPIDDSIIPLIEKEIIANYTIKDWSSFDYISISPPTWAYVVLIFVMIVTQAGFYFWANANEFDKN